jgi:hypothetical protein
LQYYENQEKRNTSNIAELHPAEPNQDELCLFTHYLFERDVDPYVINVTDIVVQQQGFTSFQSEDQGLDHYYLWMSLCILIVGSVATMLFIKLRVMDVSRREASKPLLDEDV